MESAKLGHDKEARASYDVWQKELREKRAATVARQERAEAIEKQERGTGKSETRLD